MRASNHNAGLGYNLAHFATQSKPQHNGNCGTTAETWRLMARHDLAVRERGTVPGTRVSWGETRLQGVRRQPWD